MGSLKWLLCFLVVALVAVSAQSSCPLNCSNNGNCVGGECTCYRNYEGDDCSIYNEELRSGQATNNTVLFAEWKYYNIKVSRNGEGMIWWLNRTGSDDSDCDLYIQHGTPPDRFDYLARNISTLENLEIVLLDQESGTYYAGVYGFRGCNFTISVEVTGGCPDDCSKHGSCVSGNCLCNAGYIGESCQSTDTTIQVDHTYKGHVGYQEWTYLHRVVRERVEEYDWILTNKKTNDRDDCDMYLKKGSIPSLWDWDLANVSTAAVLTINQTDVILGETYYLGIYGYMGCDYNFNLHDTKIVDPHQCPNDCSHHESLCSGGQCVCQDDYEGLECETYTPNLEINEEKTGYVGDNAWNYYHTVSTTTTGLLVSLKRTGESGDCDLYVKAGENPTRFSYDYLDITTKSNMEVEIDYPLGETWYIGVFGWNPCNYSLVVSETERCECAPPPDGHGVCAEHSTVCICEEGYSGTDCSETTVVLESGVPIQNEEIANSQWNYYVINAVNSSAIALTVKEYNTTGYLWIFLSYAEFPTLASYDYSEKSTESPTHQIHAYTKSEHTGDVYVGIYGSPFIPEEYDNKPLTIPYAIEAWVSDF